VIRSVFAVDGAGAPLAGLSLSWVTYRNAATGAVLGSPPGFTDRGNGLYVFTENLSVQTCGIIDLGATAGNRYAVFVGLGAFEVVAAFSAVDGSPLAGLGSPSWLALYNVDAGRAATGPETPALAEVGGGLYRFLPTASAHLSGSIDFGVTASPRYTFADDAPSTIGGTITIDSVTPVGGSTFADRITPVVFHVHSSAGAIAKLVVTMLYASKSWRQTVYDGSEFSYPFDSDQASLVGSGTSGDPMIVTLLPRLGWQETISEVRVIAVDAGGNVLDTVI
jgi:hypothetical protein